MLIRPQQHPHRGHSCLQTCSSFLFLQTLNSSVIFRSIFSHFSLSNLPSLCMYRRLTRDGIHGKLRLTENIIYWRSARWMSRVSELKSEVPSKVIIVLCTQADTYLRTRTESTTPIRGSGHFSLTEVPGEPFVPDLSLRVIELGFSWDDCFPSGVHDHRPVPVVGSHGSQQHTSLPGAGPLILWWFRCRIRRFLPSKSTQIMKRGQL